MRLRAGFKFLFFFHSLDVVIELIRQSVNEAKVILGRVFPGIVRDVVLLQSRRGYGVNARSLCF